MISELMAYLFSIKIAIPSAAALYLLWREQRFYRNLAKDIYGYSMYKKGPESDKLFHSTMESLCIKARDGVDRNYKSNNISLDESREIKTEIDGLLRNIKHGPRGQLWKISYFTRRKLGKLDSVAINTLGAIISTLETENNQSLSSNCSQLIKETNDALTKRALLVANTGD